MAREAARRLEEAQKSENWRKKRDAVDLKGEAANAEIQAAWGKALSAKGPHALNELLCTQREACEALIANKHRLTAEYSAELKGKDDDYVKELKRQAEEIDTLLQRMDEEYKKYQRTLQDELEHIEKAFMEERTELIDANVKELEGLFSQRRANETRYMEERAERIAENVRALESLRVHDAEEYNLVKIKLETDVQVLEQQLQQMRATYQLNTEKLDYNFQVLKKRDEENTITMNQQKRKITRLTDVLNTLKAKYNKQEKGYQQEYMGLTEDYKRITEQFKELQKKYNHFQIADNQKFRDVWKMNEEIARELMRKILLADRIIYEQQLGLTWTAPPEDLFRDVGPEVFGAGAGESAGGRECEGISPAPDAAAEDPRHHHSGAYQQEEPKGSVMDQLKTSKGYNRTVKRMLEMLCNEAGFLVEEKLSKLLAPLHRDEQSLMKIDSIFKALGIETVKDIEKLSTYFIVPENQEPDRNGSPEARVKEDGGGGPQDAPAPAPASGEPTPQLIHPNEAIRAIRRFIEEHRQTKQQKPCAAAPSVEAAEGAGSPADGSRTPADEGDGNGGVPSPGEAPSARSPTEERPGPRGDPVPADEAGGTPRRGKGARGRSPTESPGSESSGRRTPQPRSNSKSDLQNNYWARVADVIDVNGYRVWKGVYAAMSRYNQVLTERWQVTQDINRVSQQNDELKALLKQYMAAKVNDELEIPPTKIMLAQAGLGGRGPDTA